MHALLVWHLLAAVSVAAAASIVAGKEALPLETVDGRLQVDVADGGTSLSIDDGGNSITIDGTISATDLDIRDLTATDVVSVSDIMSVYIVHFGYITATPYEEITGATSKWGHHGGTDITLSVAQYTTCVVWGKNDSGSSGTATVVLHVGTDDRFIAARATPMTGATWTLTPGDSFTHDFTASSEYYNVEVTTTATLDIYVFMQCKS